MALTGVGRTIAVPLRTGISGSTGSLVFPALVLIMKFPSPQTANSVPVAVGWKLLRTDPPGVSDQPRNT